TIPPQPLLSVRETPPSSRLLRRVVPSIAILVMLLVFGLWWFSRPTNSWAQVVQAVQEKPWIHLVGKTSDGDDVEGWFSTKHQVSAERFPGHISFSDFQSGREEDYNPGTGQIFRSETDAKSSRRKSFDAFTTLFQGILRGD